MVNLPLLIASYSAMYFLSLDAAIYPYLALDDKNQNIYKLQDASFCWRKNSHYQNQYRHNIWRVGERAG